MDAASQFRPNAKGAKDLDIGHIALHTAVMNDLLRTYEQMSSSVREMEDERTAIQEIVESLQQVLYPWITETKIESPEYSTFFDLIGSYDQGVGIVISTGRGGFRWAVHQVVTLRAVLNSTLPIEIFYGGDDDLPERYRDFFQFIQSLFPDSGAITTIDIRRKFPDSHGTLGLPGGWAMRPYATLASSFKTVILADADTIFLRDPRILLDEPAFNEYGSIFWHDRILGTAPEDAYIWVDELLHFAKAKGLEKLQEQAWFQRKVYHEMERYWGRPILG